MRVQVIHEKINTVPAVIRYTGASSVYNQPLITPAMALFDYLTDRDWYVLCQESICYCGTIYK